VLWWSHWKVDSVVRAAERVCTAVVSVERRTFAIDTPKLVTVGQAIDVDRFPLRAPRHRDADEPLRVAVIGRYSPAKGVGTILRAARIALDGGLDVRVDVHGPATTDEARAEQAALARLVDELGLDGRVTLGGPVTREQVASLLAEADVLVNNAPGGADRIVYEAAATGLPVLASNRAHEDLLNRYALYDRDDAEGLAERLAAVAGLTPEQQRELARRQRARVEERHSVESWSTGLLRAAGIRDEPAPPSDGAAPVERTD
jgi:glycosyltransferase involved in cell wall biosynthesis